MEEDSLTQSISWEIHSGFAKVKPGPVMGFNSKDDFLKIRVAQKINDGN